MEQAPRKIRGTLCASQYFNKPAASREQRALRGEQAFVRFLHSFEFLFSVLWFIGASGEVSSSEQKADPRWAPISLLYRQGNWPERGSLLSSTADSQDYIPRKTPLSFAPPDTERRAAHCLPWVSKTEVQTTFSVWKIKPSPLSPDQCLPRVHFFCCLGSTWNSCSIISVCFGGTQWIHPNKMKNTSSSLAVPVATESTVCSGTKT